MILQRCNLIVAYRIGDALPLQIASPLGVDGYAGTVEGALTPWHKLTQSRLAHAVVAGRVEGAQGCVPAVKMTVVPGLFLHRGAQFGEQRAVLRLRRQQLPQRRVVEIGRQDDSIGKPS